MDQNENQYPARKKTRLVGYDYATPNYYFITICTHNKACIFGSNQRLNPLGKIAEQGFATVTAHFSSVQIHKFVVMPNHVHAIVILNDDDIKLNTVVGNYKAYVTREIHRLDANLEVWQRSFHDHIIRNQAGYEKIWNYIDGNPMKWEDDCFYPNL